MDQKLLDKMSESIDGFLKDNTIQMVITLPKGSMDADIRSSVTDLGGDVMDLYILTHAIRKCVDNLCKTGPLDPDKKDLMLDGLFDMIKGEILGEEESDEN